MAKKPKSLVEHRMGLRSGYDVYPDGSISLAPMWTDRIDGISARETGLREMQHGVTVYVTDQFTYLAKEKKRWWDEVFDELGISRGRGERWEFNDGILRRSASVDTRPEGGDATEIAAPFTGGADAQELPHD